MIKIKLSDRFKLWKKRLKYSWNFTYAHHPLCNRYEDHLFHIQIREKTLYLCQGCTLTIIGAVFGFLFSLFGLLRWIDYNWFHLTLVFTIIMSSILVVELKKVENRPVKRIIRFLGGFGLGFFAAVSLDFKTVPMTVVSVIIVIASVKAFNVVRARKHGDLCEGCAELKKKGICPGLKLKIDAEKKYSKFATKLLYSDIKKNVERKYANSLPSQNSFHRSAGSEIGLRNLGSQNKKSSDSSKADNTQILNDILDHQKKNRSKQHD